MSIRWKILGAFCLCLAFPMALYAQGAHLWVSAGVGIVLVVIFSAYSWYRIEKTVLKLRNTIAALTSKEFKDHSGGGDEFEMTLNWVDGLLKDLKSDVSVEVEKNDIIINCDERSIIQGELSSGDSVMGELYVVSSHGDRPESFYIPNLNQEGRVKLFERSTERVKQELNEMESSVDANLKKIIAFQIQILDDKFFRKGVLREIALGHTLNASLVSTFSTMKERLSSVKNAYIRERSTDLDDLLSHLQKVMFQRDQTRDLKEKQLSNKIVYLQALFPSDVIKMHQAGIRGIVTSQNTKSSHAQILLNSLGIASVTSKAFQPQALEGRKVLLNTTDKNVVINPNDEDQKKLESQSSDDIELKVIESPVQLKDGEKVSVEATINHHLEVGDAVKMGADGIGLFRTEMDLLQDALKMDEESFYEHYSTITKNMRDKPITIRILDLGGDKLAPLGPTSSEDNPFLGHRAIRYLLSQPEIFKRQLRAIKRLETRKVKVLFPFISRYSEIIKIREILDQVDDQGGGLSQPYGIMVEVPSVVERFEDFVDDFDFFNLGLNDLTQHTLAVDRNNAQVSDYFTPLHPAILSMIKKVSSLCRDRGKDLYVCGEAASDVSLTKLFIGLGIRHFSARPPVVPVIKSAVGNFDLKFCEELAVAALRCKQSEEVQALVKKYA